MSAPHRYIQLCQGWDRINADRRRRDREGHGTERPQASPQPRDEPLLPSPDNTNPKAGAPEHG